MGDFAPRLSLEHFINDFLMAIFFLLVGLEIKFEMTAGELTNPRKALLPIVAAAGGAVVPALVYTAVNAGSGFEQGWGVPMANDIAFCLGILALLGDRVPLGLRVFLSTLTIADDMIAILVIAVFYTANLDVTWLAGAWACSPCSSCSTGCTSTTCCRTSSGLGMWVCFPMSGVHATIAGVLLALAIPALAGEARSCSRLVCRPARRADDRYDPGEPTSCRRSTCPRWPRSAACRACPSRPSRASTIACTFPCTSSSCRCSHSRTPAWC
ncbi:MAG: Na+/H+ antiporter NhaA [Eggerthella lenta]